jgi:preprotein translocase subunit SecG
MVTFVSFIHVIMSLILIIIVLLQTGKGSDLASAFGGGGANTMFGSHGAASFLNKLTTVAAIMFMLTSLTLAILSASPEKSFMDDVAVPPAAKTESGQPAVSLTPVPAGSETGQPAAESAAPSSSGTTEGGAAPAGQPQVNPQSDAAPASPPADKPASQPAPTGDGGVTP